MLPSIPAPGWFIMTDMMGPSLPASKTARTDRYAAFAAIYDVWQNQFHPPFWEYVLQRTGHLVGTVGTVLDLACGTGAWSLPMARAGATVYAVDRSGAMLRELKKKRGRLPIHAQQASMTDFRLPEPVDAAGCFFDSLNHLASLAELQATFHCVAAALRPGAPFLFDLNNEACFRHLWEGHFITHAPDYTVTMISHYDEMRRQAASDVVVFLPLPGKSGRMRLYRQQRTVIEERCFTDDEVRKALRAAGFTRIQTEPVSPFPEISADPLKTWWSARRA